MSGIISDIQLVTADAAQVASLFGPHKWGIANSSGQIIVACDSVISFDYSSSYNIPNYPIEGGSFTSYNKVYEPFEIKMVLALGGNNPIANAIAAANSGSLTGVLNGLTGVSARTTFLQQIEAAKTSLEILSVLTPELTYPSVNVVHVDYNRNPKEGVTLLKVEIWLEQVNQTARSTVSNTVQPQSADAVTTGPASGYTPSVSQTATVTTQSLQ